MLFRSHSTYTVNFITQTATCEQKVRVWLHRNFSYDSITEYSGISVIAYSGDEANARLACTISNSGIVCRTYFGVRHRSRRLFEFNCSDHPQLPFDLEDIAYELVYLNGLQKISLPAAWKHVMSDTIWGETPVLASEPIPDGDNVRYLRRDILWRAPQRRQALIIQGRSTGRWGGFEFTTHSVGDDAGFLREFADIYPTETRFGTLSMYGREI